MISKPIDVLEQFPVRKSKKQKQAFRDAVQAYAQGLGYPVTVEKGSMGAKNIVMGDPNGANYLVTAHYDTPACMVVPNFLTPTNLLTFILYQLFLVAVLFLISGAAGFVVDLLTNDFMLGFAAWYVVYFGALLLMMFGPANPHNANDNTSGVVTVLETLTSIPENQRHKVCFVLFDLEEAGLIGSASYRKAHKKATEKQIVLNLDCVGDGNELIMFPTAKLKKDKEKLIPLAKICGYFGEKSLLLKRKGFYIYPSDQGNFPYGVGIAAFRRAKFIGPYCSRIHTWRDTFLETTNVNILRAAIVSLICQ